MANVYSSGKHTSVSADPYPNVWARHTERNQMRADTDVFRKGAPGPRYWPGYQSRPRPEYDRTLTNEANPILVEFRRTAPWDLAKDAWGEAQWLGVNPRPIPSDATPDQINHARKVLTRLANFTTKEN